MSRPKKLTLNLLYLLAQIPTPALILGSAAALAIAVLIAGRQG